MDECIHGLEFGCTLCSGKETLLGDKPEDEPTIPLLLPKRTGRKDPASTIAADVAIGKRCGKCLVLHAPQGCDCSRRAIYDDKFDGAIAMLREAVDAGSISGKEGAGHAFSVLKRAGRKAGIGFEQRPDRPSDAEADRADIIEAFDVEPRWQPYRRTEADYLPI